MAVGERERKNNCRKNRLYLLSGSFYIFDLGGEKLWVYGIKY